MNAMKRRAAAVLAAAVLMGCGAAPAPRSAPAPEPRKAAAHRASPPLRASLSPYDKVAETYYNLAEAAELSREEQAERSKKAMWDEGFPVPPVAGGIVLNRKGEPVAGAKVTVEKENSGIMLGEGTTNENGQFSIALSEKSYRGVDLIVEADGYVRWALGGIYGGVVDHRVVMDRPVDGALIDSLLSEKLPEERLWKLLEICGPRQMGMDIKDIFPHIGRLRKDLRRLASSKAFEEGKPSPAGRARELLFYWFEPADEDLVEEPPGGVVVPGDVSGPARAQVESAWAKLHFTGEKIEGQPPPHSFSVPVTDPEETRALVEFSVHYAHWGYSQLLFMKKEGETWRLVHVQDHMHWHGL